MSIHVMQVTNKKVLDRRNYQGGDIKEDAFIFMVLEYGEIDLANMLSAKCKQQGTGKWKLDAENPVETAWLRLYWLVYKSLSLQVFDMNLPHDSVLCVLLVPRVGFQAFSSVVCYSIYWRL
jgi:serine/threonine-protein kinase TTK/MPS1